MRLFHISTATRLLATLVALGGLSISTAQAGPTKADCKGHSAEIKKLSSKLGLSSEVGGRVMMNAIQLWSGKQDPGTIADVAGRIEQAVEGVKQCEAGGMGGAVRAAKPMSLKLKSVLPWLKATVEAGPCQDLINEAVRKKDEDTNGAIADLQRSIRECDDPGWVSEARGNLISIYYSRGNGDDYAKALELSREALASSSLVGENRIAFRAIVAKTAIEAGIKLMNSGDYAAARAQWQGYVDVFGTADFGIVAEGGQSVDGLWDLKDASFQITLACLELGDFDCATERIRSAADSYREDSRPLRELIGRAFDQAATSGAVPTADNYKVAFDLLNLWHDIEPDSFQLSRFVHDRIRSKPGDERRRLLKATHYCWIPTTVAKSLKDDEQPFIPETEIAAACSGPGGDAQQMLVDLRLSAVQEKIDRLAFGGRSNREIETLLVDIEQMLTEIKNPADVERFRRTIAEERRKLVENASRDAQERERRYAGCTDLLATIQWNMARENDYDAEVRDFKASCCRALASSTSGWTSHMQAKLSSDQVQKKLDLMRRLCQ